MNSLSAFFNCRDYFPESNFIKAGDAFLTPVRYLFKGEEWVDDRTTGGIKAVVQFPERTVLGGCLALLGLIPGLILGVFLKAIGRLTNETIEIRPIKGIGSVLLEYEGKKIDLSMTSTEIDSTLAYPSLKFEFNRDDEVIGSFELYRHVLKDGHINIVVREATDKLGYDKETGNWPLSEHILRTALDYIEKHKALRCELVCVSKNLYGFAYRNGFRFADSANNNLLGDIIEKSFSEGKLLPEDLGLSDALYMSAP